MSQRVYLIPVDDALVQTFLSAVGQTTEPAVSRLRDAASRQSQLASMSKQFAARLDEDAFRERNLFDSYARCTALRPYVITEESPATAAQAVHTLWSLEGDDKRRQFFAQQLQAFDPSLLTDGGDATDDDSGSWAILEEDLRRVRGLRSAALGGTPYIVPVAKQEPFGDSMVVTSDETETIVLRGRQVVEAYGNLLATCLARFAGLCRPTWWLGRNFWLGQLAVANLPLRRRLMMSEASRMQARLKSLVTTPAQLLAPLKVKGFEAGLSLCCEAYSAGLYLSPAAAGELLSEIRRQPGVFLDLAATVTRYPKGDVAQLTAIIEEALSWASQSGHGLIEGDELVGSQGYR